MYPKLSPSFFVSVPVIPRDEDRVPTAISVFITALPKSVASAVLDLNIASIIALCCFCFSIRADTATVTNPIAAPAAGPYLPNIIPRLAPASAP